MKKLKGLLRYVSYAQLSRTIAGYGYEYSVKTHIVKVVLSLFAMTVAGIAFYLDLGNIVILGVTAFLVTGIIAISQFAYMANNDRFEALANYMEMMILYFKRQPKILSALEQTLEHVSDNKDMKRVLGEAISIITGDTRASNVYRKAFDVIEAEFPCSRLHTLHGFLLSVEMESSLDYQDGLNNLYFDIRSWITRTYEYQGELKNLKRKISIILFLSIGIAAFFARLLHKAELGMPEGAKGIITQSTLFQLSTVIYLLIFILLYTLLQSKINGQWLINDMSERTDAKIGRYISFVENYDDKRERKKSVVAAAVFIPFVVIGITMNSVMISGMGFMLILLCLFKPGMTYKSRKKAVEKALIREFPMWLREISMKLNNTVVVRAIEESIDDSAAVLSGFLMRFIERTQKDPTSIKPYRDFLGKFDAAELSTAFKTLYAVQTLSKSESKKYVTDLIERNQILVEKAERMRNEDSLAGVTFISLMPMLLMSFKLILDMGLLIAGFLSFSKGIM